MRLLVLLLLPVAACSGPQWTTRPDNYHQAALLLRPVEATGFRIGNDHIQPEIWDRFQAGTADSILHAMVNRLIQAPVYRAQGVRITESYAESDYVLQVTDVRVDHAFTLDFVRPGPVVRVRLVLEAYQGATPVFRDERTGLGNMARLARTEPGLYWLNGTEKADGDLQRRALEAAWTEALGDALSAFMQLNR